MRSPSTGGRPKFDGGIVTRLDCVPFSIVVNKHAERFYDEGEGRLAQTLCDLGPAGGGPARSGRLCRSSTRNRWSCSCRRSFPPIKADTLEELAGKMACRPDKLRRKRSMTSTPPAATLPPSIPPSLDGVATTGSNRRRPTGRARSPSRRSTAIRCAPGVTFTYLGLKVDENAQCSTGTGPIENLWAAGETMAGSILGQGYLAGFGMTIGTVFGRIAGREAASHAERLTCCTGSGRRQAEICNACRYCEGYCSVFPGAAPAKRVFSTATSPSFANLCHNCRGCYYACQYSEPHEFAINLPRRAGRAYAGTVGRIWPIRRGLARLPFTTSGAADRRGQTSCRFCCPV